jgi:hypothetical protein
MRPISGDFAGVMQGEVLAIDGTPFPDLFAGRADV